ncbi:MAG: hypothetical protein ACO1QB_03765 [Verrucomicrobiales bacterium]
MPASRKTNGGATKARKRKTAKSRTTLSMEMEAAESEIAQGRTGLPSLTETERLLLAEMVMALPLAEVQQQVAGPVEDGGFNLRLSSGEIETFYLQAQKEAVQSSQKNLGEVNRVTVEEDVYRRIGTSVLCLLQQRLQKLLGAARPKPDEIKTYFTLLLASRKLDLVEKKALDANKKPHGPSEEEKMEMVWDMFALPEDERVRRRALWKAYQQQSPQAQQATVELLAREEGE